MINQIKTPLIAAGLFSILMMFHPSMGLTGHPVPPAPAPPPQLPLPKIILPAPPYVVVIPGTYVYFATDVAVDLLFYHGYWYRPFEGRWYRGTGHNGPWVFLPPHNVPQPLLHLPRDYRRPPPGHQRIPPGQLQKNWRIWEQEKHWDRPR